MKVLVFAQVPPPEHGQSRMVKRMLEGLAEDPGNLEIHHVDCRFSDTFDEIGNGSLRKVWRLTRYVREALRVAEREGIDTLYYVPGPVGWGAVVRDWMVLSLLRPAFRRVVFHWHAIGHGEWAAGSERLAITKWSFLDQAARWVSRRVLRAPDLSLVLTRSSGRDAAAVRSKEIRVVPNGVDDPHPEWGEGAEHRRMGEGAVRLLYLAVGSEQKGLWDFLGAVERLLERGERHWEVRMAGGVKESAKEEFERRKRELEAKGGKRLKLEVTGYVSGAEKQACYEWCDVFVVPSWWESFGLTVVEAMAQGVPVVAAASDGVKGVLPEDYPYLVPTKDPEGLAAAVERAASDPEGSRRLGRELRGEYVASYAMPAFFAGVRSALEDAAAGRAGAAPAAERKLRVAVYLADQNPKLGRSLGISRMTEAVLSHLGREPEIELLGVASKSSIQLKEEGRSVVLPWGTRHPVSRVLTDHLHPIWLAGHAFDLSYFPKGFLPRMHGLCGPTVVTIHDTIIQYYADHYPEWRTEVEYGYWASMLKFTLAHAECILTVSKAAKRQIEDFVERYGLPRKEITVTYEPCLYESVPQPENPAKSDYVLHLGSKEPHKRTGWLVKQWAEARRGGRKLPELHVVGRIPEEEDGLVGESGGIVRLPFLDDAALRAKFEGARALILPSEIEGFGLPAVESYYLGTPVCFTAGTSIEEVLSVATDCGGFDLEVEGDLFRALEEVFEMPAAEVRACGLRLREEYATKVVVERMVQAFQRVSPDGRKKAMENPIGA